MPDFGEFNYFFVLDVLKISKFDYSLSTVVSSAMAIATPVIFQRLLTKWITVCFGMSLKCMESEEKSMDESEVFSPIVNNV